MGKTPGTLTRQNDPGDPAPAGHVIPEVAPDLGRVYPDGHRQREPEAAGDGGLALLGQIAGVEQAEGRPVRRPGPGDIEAPGPLARLVQPGEDGSGFGPQVQSAEELGLVTDPGQYH